MTKPLTIVHIPAHRVYPAGAAVAGFDPSQRGNGATTQRSERAAIRLTIVKGRTESHNPHFVGFNMPYRPRTDRAKDERGKMGNRKGGQRLGKEREDTGTGTLSDNMVERRRVNLSVWKPGQTS